MITYNYAKDMANYNIVRNNIKKISGVNFLSYEDVLEYIDNILNNNILNCEPTCIYFSGSRTNTSINCSISEYNTLVKKLTDILLDVLKSMGFYIKIKKEFINKYKTFDVSFMIYLY